MNLIRITLIVAALLPWVTTAQPVWLNDGLVAYYPFGGDAKDATGNGNDGTVNGATLAADMFGVEGSAYYFDGNDDIAIAGTQFSKLPENYTVSTWVMKTGDSTDGLASIVGSNDRNTGWWLFYRRAYAPGANFQFSNQGQGESFTYTSIENNQWHHILVTYDGENVTIFLDANKVTEDARSAASSQTSNTVYFGYQHSNHPGRGWVGYIDETRLYNRALSATEVAELYEYESAPPARPIEEWIDDGLVAYYPFDGDAKDYSGNGNDGEVNGATLAKSRQGKLDSAYQFDGSNDYIGLGAAGRYTETFSGSLALSVWLRASRHHHGTIFQFGDNLSARANQEFGVYLNTGRVIAIIRGTNGQGAGTNLTYTDTDVHDSEWHHLAIVKEKDSYNYLYLDGNLIASKNDTSGSIIPRSSDIVHLGRALAYNGYNAYFDGALDDVRIYNRALSSTEVAQLYAYESQPPSNTRKASAMAQIVNGFIVGAEVLDGGYGYSSNPEVTISGGGGFGAVATATVSAGKVVKINIINPGFGYTGDPTIDIAAPPVPPAPAYATAEVVNGFLVGTLLVTGGDGYTEPPAVKVTGGNGQGAVLATEIANGRVVAVNVINPGSGYTTAPVITIAPPPTAPELSIRVTQVEVNMKLTEGKRYTIESSKNMVDWTQTGPLFVAEEQFMAVKFDVDEFGQFFRVIEQP